MVIWTRGRGSKTEKFCGRHMHLAPKMQSIRGRKDLYLYPEENRLVSDGTIGKAIASGGSHNSCRRR